ncbi:hypothetical protein PAXRUDRAFT_834265, partial [Paxillus rubicundulus Ve08.2h10]
MTANGECVLGEYRAQSRDTSQSVYVTTGINVLHRYRKKEGRKNRVRKPPPIS